MGFAVAALNDMLDNAAIDTVSLHTGNPGTSGASNEVASASGYARQSATFPSASGGTLTMSNAPSFSVPATTVAYVGFWAGSTFIGSDAVTSEVFGAPGSYTLTAATLSITP